MFMYTQHISPFICFFFFNDTATTEIYTLSLHDALPISCSSARQRGISGKPTLKKILMYQHLCRDDLILLTKFTFLSSVLRSEEHTSELQSPCNLVCRLLLEKKKNIVSMLCVYERV